MRSSCRKPKCDEAADLALGMDRERDGPNVHNRNRDLRAPRWPAYLGEPMNEEDNKVKLLSAALSDTAHAMGADVAQFHTAMILNLGSLISCFEPGLQAVMLETTDRRLRQLVAHMSAQYHEEPNTVN